MQLINPFKKKSPSVGYCGGLKCVNIVGRFGKLTGMKIYYERPTSDMIMDYIYNYQTLIEEDTQLRGIAKKKNQFGEMATRLTELIFIPYSEKIFHHCEGFVDKDGKSIKTLKPEEQFKLLKKYHSYYFADLCTIAYELLTKVKKKD